MDVHYYMEANETKAQVNNIQHDPLWFSIWNSLNEVNVRFWSVLNK